MDVQKDTSYNIAAIIKTSLSKITKYLISLKDFKSKLFFKNLNKASERKMYLL